MTAILASAMLLLGVAGQASAETIPAPTVSIPVTATPSTTAVGTATPSPTASVSPSSSASPTATATASATASASATATPAAVPPVSEAAKTETAPAIQGATVGVSAQAATSYTCSPNDLYLLTSSSSTTGAPAILKYSNGTLSTVVSSLGTLPTTQPDALAVSQSGYAYFMATLPATGSLLMVYRVNLADGSRTAFGGAMVLGTTYADPNHVITATAGAINPVNGIYYYALATGSYAWDFYAFDTNTNTSIGYVGRLTTPTADSGFHGDIAFDGDGNLYLGINTATGKLYKVDTANVPTTARSLATAIPSTSLGSTAETYTTGLAHIAPTSGTKSLYSISYYKSAINVRSPGTANDSTVYATISNSYIYDMASCPGPSKPTLSLSKNVESRVKTGDQFTLTVKDSAGATVGSPATTSGTATGAQATKVGPVTVSEGSTYTLQESASGTTTLSDYAITAACTASGTPLATTGSDGTFAVTVPTDAKGLIACVITNGPPKIELKKNVAKRVNATDQFKLDIRSSSGSIGTATTTGTATGVQAATASASVSPGTTYTLQETGTGATNLARYNTSAACSAGGTTVAATKTANGAFDVTVPVGTKGVVACEISNTPIPTLSLAKNVVGRVNDTDQFTLSVADGGATLGTPATTVGAAHGVQGVKVAAVDVVAGQTYTLKEVGAGGTVLTDYDKSATCTASDGSTVATTGSNGTWTVTIPPGAIDLTSCEIKNVAPPSITVTKTIPNSRFAASDQFTVQLRTGGATGVVLDTPGNETTAGTGSGVTTGTGTTGRYRATAGTAYTITEAPGVGVDSSKYTAKVTCTDATGTQTGLPNETLLGEAGVTVTPQAGAQISCSLANASTAGAGVGIGEGLTCEAGFIYAIASTNPARGGYDQNGAMVRSYGYVYKINATTGAATVALNNLTGWNPKAELPSTPDASLGMADYNSNRFSGRVNALAISQGGLYSYYSTQRTSTMEPAGLPVFQQDNKTGTTVRLATMAIPTDITYVATTTSGGTTLPVPGGAGTVRGGIDPTTGIYWVSSSEPGNATTHHFWAYNTLTNQNYGYVGYISGAEAVTPTGGNGDLVFDQEGNLLFVSSTNSTGQLWRVAGLSNALAGTPKTTATSINNLVSRQKLTDLTTSGQFNGVTFDNDGYLYVSFSDNNGNSKIQKLDPNTGTAIGSAFTVSGLGTPDSRVRTVVDLADCNDPGGLRLQKTYESRVAAADNVKLEIKRTDQPTKELPGGTVTTDGPATGMQTNAAAVAIGVPAKTYTLKETTVSGTTALSSYSTTLSCVDKTHGDAPLAVAKVSQGEYTLDFPGVTAADGQLLANVVCTYTNKSSVFDGPSCEDGRVYSINDNGRLEEVQFDPATGQATMTDYNGWQPNGGAYNGLGISMDGSKMYAYEVQRDGGPTADPGAGANARDKIRVVTWSNGAFSPTPSAWFQPPAQGTWFYFITGAVNPVNGHYVFGGYTQDAAAYPDNGGLTYLIYDYNPTTGQFTTLGNFPASDPDKTTKRTNSDIAFDAAGNMYVLQSLPDEYGANASKTPVRLFTVTADNLAAATGGTVAATAANWFDITKATIAGGSTAEAVVGLAFGDDGSAYLSTKTLVYRFNPATWEQLGAPQQVLTSSADLASCSSPSTLTVQKDVVGRSHDSDQFGLSASLAGQELASAVTAGGELGIQAQQVGPVAVHSNGGTTYNFGEALAAGSASELATAYTTAWVCTDSSGRELSSGTGDSGEVVFDQVGLNVTCVLTNTPAGSAIKVEKLGQHCDVGQSTCALDGAVFALYDTDPSVAGAMPVADGIAADVLNGSTFTSKALKAGTYWLVETQAPTGFTLLPQPIEFTLAAAGITLSDPVDGIVTLKADDTFTILVTDTTPAPLPKAGGSGPWPYYAMGLLLLVVAGCSYQIASGPRMPLRRAVR